MTTPEIWKDVPGFEGRYQASDQGRVRSLDRHVRAVSKAGREYARKVKGCVLRPGLSRGYMIVNLQPRGTAAVHLIVARTFLGAAPFANAEANHKNGVKTSNAASNLEWTTRSGNQLHAVDLGLKKQAIRVVAPSGATYSSIAQAARSERVSHRTAATWSRA